jgi:predicted PurR-regulated permease PerM
MIQPSPESQTDSGVRPTLSADRVHLIEARVVDLVIRLLLLGLFAYLSLALIRPFLVLVTWAIILAVALAPVHGWLVRLLGGRNRLSAVIVTLAVLLVVIGPVAALTSNLIDTVRALAHRVGTGGLQLPPPPAWLETLPLIGQQSHAFWATASDNMEGVLADHRQMLAPIGAKAITIISGLGLGLVKIFLSIVLAGLLLVPGPRLARGGRKIATRILAPRGEQFVELAGVTVRNVSRGVVGIAVLQAILIGIVLHVAGLQGAGVLALIILILCILQIGPALVVLPVLIWAWLTLSLPQALLLTAILVPLTLMDNVLKPMLMGRGLSTPTLVIFMGVIGGTLSYGLIGLFVGPVVLAVFYDLLVSWLQHDPDATTKI